MIQSRCSIVTAQKSYKIHLCWELVKVPIVLVLELTKLVGNKTKGRMSKQSTLNFLKKRTFLTP